MELSVKQYKRCAVISINGDLNSDAAPQLKDKVEELHATGCVNLVIDLKNASFVGSAGLRAFINIKRDCERLKGALLLSRVPENTLLALETSGLLAIFEIKDTLEDAIGSF